MAPMARALRQADGIAVREAGARDLEWIVERHRALYERERGWDERFGRLVAGVVDEFRRAPEQDRQRGWIAEAGGRRAGSVLCVAESEEVAKLRLLLVEPELRGRGVGSALLDTCIDFAAERGYQRLVLWTNDVLTEAASLYRRAGFQIVAENPHDMFGPAMVGQTYELDLGERASA
jgi:GNAT superfamily N-acetyltransferase